jgi:hypothetical protein
MSSARRVGCAVWSMVALATGLFPALVAAQSGGDRAGGQPRQIVGSGSFNDAPLVGPGRYQDTIRGAETNVYAIELAPGQRLRASATVREVEQRVDNGTIAYLQLEILGPNRRLAGFPDASDRDSLFSLADPTGEGEVSVNGATAEDPVEALAAADWPAYPAAGLWYVKVTLDDPNREAGRNELPLLLRLTMHGVARGEAPAAPGVEPPESETPLEPEQEGGEPAEEPDSSGDEDEGSSSGDSGGTISGGALVAIGIGGLLLGAAAGIPVARSRDR